MSESDTMFNERDRRCAAVQLMLSTDPSYDNRKRLVEKACSQFQICIDVVIEAEGGYIE